MLNRTFAIALILAAVSTVALAAQGQELEQHLQSLPGYVDARRLGLDRGEEELAVEVNLHGPMIRFFAETTRGADPELADALAKIESFRFRLFRLPPGEVEEVRRRVERAAASLAAKGWERVVRIREQDNQGHLFLQMRGERIVGLTVLFVDEESQLGFVNLAGEIDPAQVGRIGRRYDIDLLEEAQGEIERSQKEGSR